MKTRTALSILAAAALIAVSATHTFAGGHGFSLGMRAGYGIPMGTAGDGTDLNELTSGAVPIQLDLNYNVTERWQAGAYVSSGPARVADETKDALEAQGLTDVSGHPMYRLGVQGLYNFAPMAGLTPWAGAGVGYNWMHYAEAKLPSGKDTEFGLRGFEASVQAGANYNLTPRFGIGPYAAMSFGQFRTYVTWVDGSDTTTKDVDDKGIHEWLQFGLKATVSL